MYFTDTDAAVLHVSIRRRLLFIVLSLFLAFITGGILMQSAPKQAHAQAAEATWLRAEGNKLVNESGEAVILRGANIVRYNWKYPNSTALEQDLNVARTFTKPAAQGGWGANSFTIWIESNPVLAKNAEYMQWVDGMVGVAKENGAYVILSWHDDWHNPSMSHPERITENGFEAMAALAKRYKDIPNVIYAAQAEPGFWTSSVSRWRELRDQQEHMIDGIRAENPKALVGVAGAEWSQDVQWMLTDPVRRDNIFVKPHIYATVPEVWSARSIPQVAAKWPVVIGEFGTGGRMDNGDSQDLIRYADENLSGWQAWNLADEGPPVLLTSHQTVTPTAYGQMVRTELAREVSPPTPPAQTPTATPTAAPPAGPAALPLRINAGGTELKDSAGNNWLADQAHGGTNTWGYAVGTGASGQANHDVTIKGTTNNGVFSSERWGMMSYRVNLPDGKYDVRLLFAETYSGITAAGQRKFDVTIEGTKLLSSLDAFAEAGFGTALVKEFRNVNVTDGRLDIEFGRLVENPMIKGIEVFSAGTLTPAPTVTPTPTPTPTATATPSPTPTATATPSPTPTLTPVAVPLRINAGGAAVKDIAGNSWLGDQEYSPAARWGYVLGTGASGQATHSLTVKGTSDNAIFSTERWGMTGYRTDLPNGKYDVRLLFAETYSGITAAGQRQFDVTVEGTKVLPALDAYATAGFGAAFVKEIRAVTVADGRLDIQFGSIVENPMIKGIEILASGTLPPPDVRVHVPGLEGWSQRYEDGSWEAFSRVSVRNASLQPVAGAGVTLRWTANGSSWMAFCTTGIDGRCTAGSGTIPTTYSTASAQVTEVIVSGSPFDSSRGTTSVSVSR